MVHGKRRWFPRQSLVGFRQSQNAPKASATLWFHEGAPEVVDNTIMGNPEVALISCHLPDRDSYREVNFEQFVAMSRI